MIRIALLAEAALVPAALGLGWLFDAPPFSALTWTTRGLAWGVLGTAPLLLALAWCLRTTWAPAVELVHLVRVHLAPIVAGAGRAELLLVALLAGLGEEALFRGVIQPVLARHLPLPLAVAATATAFGVVHWLTPLYALLAGLVGAYLGWMRVAAGGLLAPIVAHALYDAIALAVLVRSRAGERPGPE
jgi:CAAX protease family protein